MTTRITVEVSDKAADDHRSIMEWYGLGPSVAVELAILRLALVVEAERRQQNRAKPVRPKSRPAKGTGQSGGKPAEGGLTCIATGATIGV